MSSSDEFFLISAEASLSCQILEEGEYKSLTFARLLPISVLEQIGAVGVLEI